MEITTKDTMEVAKRIEERLKEEQILEKHNRHTKHIIQYEINQFLKIKEKKPLAYLSKRNFAWMQDPKDEDMYIPYSDLNCLFPVPRKSYHYTYCEEIGCIPLYDHRLIERFKLNEDGKENI